MRGFFGGLVLGSIVMAAGLAALSIVSPLPKGPEVVADAPQDTGSSPAEDTAGDVKVSETPEPAPKDDAPDAPAVTEATADDLAKMADADTAPADKPEVGAATGQIAQPDTPGETGVASDGAEAPIAPVEQAETPAAPQEDAEPQVETAIPVQPAAPAMGESGAGVGPEAPEEEPAPQVAASVDTPPSQVTPSEQVSSPAEETAPEAQTESAAQPEPAPESAPESAPEPEPEAEETQPRIAALPQATEDELSSSGPSIGTPVVPLTERGKPAAAAEAQTNPQQAEDERPLAAFAAPYKAEEDQPKMAIVLIDDAEALGVEALGDFTFPVTVAIDPSDPEAIEKMVRHRDAGLEVVAMVNLPAAASAGDAEVSMEVWLGALNETVAILEGTGSGIQGNRDLANQVAAIAGSTGRGLITQDNGLNTVQKLAERDGVPSAVVFRDFDGAGQTPTVMRRFLDQAAFRAGQQGDVIMLGRIRPDTISALVLWGLQDRASRVALVPVSAVLAPGEAATE